MQLFNRACRWLVAAAVLLAALAACGRSAAVAPPTAQPPTTAPPTMGCESAGYSWAYGDRLPDVEAAIGSALKAVNISGDITANTFGETGGCSGYHPMQLDVKTRVLVEKVDDATALKSKADQIAGAIRQAYDQTKPAPNLGKIEITFVAGSAECLWDLENSRCFH
jgi:hypothetical protein